MGIFKKTKSQEIPIKPSISDSEREAERLRQLEASLDFLRDKPSPPKKAEPPLGTADASYNADVLSGALDTTARKETQNRMVDCDQPESKDSKENGKEKITTNETGNGSEGSKDNNAATVQSNHDKELKDNIQNSSGSDATMQEVSVSKESNVALSQKEAEEDQKKSIRNKYGRRMDYKTAKVSTAGQNGNSSVATVSKDASYVKRSEGVTAADKTSEISPTNKADSDIQAEGFHTENHQIGAAAAVSKAVLSSNSDPITAGNTEEVASQTVFSVNSVPISEGNAASGFSENKVSEQKATNLAEEKESVLQKDNLTVNSIENLADTKDVTQTDTQTMSQEDTKADTKADTSAVTPLKETAKAIQNPLPVPAKHAHREMEFDIMPSPEDMHFDLVDLSGIDFFDIN